MSSWQFPALAVQPPQQVDMLGQYAKMLQIKQALQQQQYQQQIEPLQLQQEQQAVALQQQQVRDIQAGQDAYSEWDPTSGYTNLASLFIKHGGSLPAANQLAAYGLAQQEKLANTLKAQSDASRAQVEALQKNHDIAAGAVNSLLDLPDNQLQQGVLDMAQRGVKEGWFDQQHFAAAQQLAGQTPAQIRAVLPHLAKGYMAESQIAEDALKNAQTFEAQQRGLVEQAMQQYGGSPTEQDAKATYLMAQQAKGAPLSADDQAFLKGYTQRKLLVPEFRVENRQSDIGTWSLQEDQQGNPILFNSKTGQTQPAPPGMQKIGTFQKTVGPAQEALSYANDYRAGNHTGPGDEALMEKFFELAKPSTGFRMSQPQQDMLRNAQGWLDSWQAKARHATVGTYFSDTQRNQIIDTMNALATAKLKHVQGAGAQPTAPGGAAGAQPAAPPSGAPNWGSQFGGTPH